MPTFTWLGGGSNSFNTPSDWNPQGPPADGDSIIMPSGLDMAIGGATVTGAVAHAGKQRHDQPGAAAYCWAWPATWWTAMRGADQVTAEAARHGGRRDAHGGGGGRVERDAGDRRRRHGHHGRGRPGRCGASTSAGRAAAAALTVGGGSGSAVLDDAGDLVDGAFGQARVTVTAGGTLDDRRHAARGRRQPAERRRWHDGGERRAADREGRAAFAGLDAGARRWPAGSSRSAGRAPRRASTSRRGRRCSAPGWSAAISPTMERSSPSSSRWRRCSCPAAASPAAGRWWVTALASALDIFTTVHYGNPVAFSGPAAVLQLEAPAALQGAISGFGIGDAIDLPGVKFPPSATLSYDGVAGVLHFGADAFAVGTGYDAQNFALHPEPVGTGTKIVPVAPQAALRLSPDHARCSRAGR